MAATLSLREFQSAFLNMHETTYPDPVMRWEKESPVIRYVGEGGTESFWYSVSLGEPCRDEQTVADVVDREIRLAASRNRNMEWKVYEFPEGPGLASTLESRGLRCTRKSRLLYSPVEDVLREIRVSPEIRVEPAESIAQLEELRDLSGKVWGQEATWLVDTLWREISAPNPGTHVYLARNADGLAVSCGWMRALGNIAWLFGGSTVQDFRGRGAYRALVRERALRARFAGIQFLLSECSPDSERVLNRLGFSDAGVALLYER